MSKFELKNPDAPMSFKQGIMIRNLGGGDARGEGLTMQQASDRISELMPAKDGERGLHFKLIWDEAVAAGIKAGQDAIPTPMVVAEHENMFDDNSPVKNSWMVEGGACGFAWVNVKPGTSAFAKWLKKTDYARKDSYCGGVTIWISEHGQSVTRKEAHAAAMAQVFQKAGFNAYAMSRLD